MSACGKDGRGGAGRVSRRPAESRPGGADGAGPAAATCRALRGRGASLACYRGSRRETRPETRQTRAEEQRRRSLIHRPGSRMPLLARVAAGATTARAWASYSSSLFRRTMARGRCREAGGWVCAGLKLPDALPRSKHTIEQYRLVCAQTLVCRCSCEGGCLCVLARAACPAIRRSPGSKPPHRKHGNMLANLLNSPLGAMNRRPPQRHIPSRKEGGAHSRPSSVPHPARNAPV